MATINRRSFVAATAASVTAPVIARAKECPAAGMDWMNMSLQARNSAYNNPGSKPVATIYWDDRSVCYSGDAFQDLAAIRNFRTWNGRR